MIKRCSVPTLKNKSYIKRNIQVCQDWLFSFDNFYNWAVNNGYDDSLTLDRIHNYSNYQPNNCRWVSKEANNRYQGNISRPEIGY